MRILEFNVPASNARHISLYVVWFMCRHFSREKCKNIRQRKRQNASHSMATLDLTSKSFVESFQRNCLRDFLLPGKRARFWENINFAQRFERKNKIKEDRNETSTVIWLTFYCFGNELRRRRTLHYTGLHKAAATTTLRINFPEKCYNLFYLFIQSKYILSEWNRTYNETAKIWSKLIAAIWLALQFFSYFNEPSKYETFRSSVHHPYKFLFEINQPYVNIFPNTPRKKKIV